MGCLYRLGLALCPDRGICRADSFLPTREKTSQRPAIAADLRFHSNSTNLVGNEITAQPLGRWCDVCLASGPFTCGFALGVEVRGFETLASSVRGRRSAGQSYTPRW